MITNASYYNTKNTDGLPHFSITKYNKLQHLLIYLYQNINMKVDRNKIDYLFKEERWLKDIQHYTSIA